MSDDLLESVRPSPESLLSVARRLADEAGAFLLAGWSKPRHSIETKSTATDMVSEMDKGGETLIVQGIGKVRPDDAILGEEGTAQPGTTGVRWVIDPLDGTTSYLYGLPGWCVSIGVEIDGSAVAGVVYAPALGQEFWASSGGGAFADGLPIAASSCTDISSALIATGFGYIREQRARQGAIVAAMLPRIRDIRRSGSAALDLCYAAAGRVDVYFEEGCNPWDLAAGVLIAREAGAVVTDLDGGEPGSSMCVAAPEALHRGLISLIRG